MAKRAYKVSAKADGLKVLRDTLAYAEPRPNPLVAEKEDKVAYAVRFAEKMAELMATDLAKAFPGTTASSKRVAQAVAGSKQLDVNYSTPELGLGLGVSLKSVHLRDAKKHKKTKAVTLGRYTHNMKRNEEELRIEASGYHKRQPYAVMVAVLFLPFDSCDDGKRESPSSFGGWVRHLQPFAGREGPSDDVDRFEKIYIGLYDPAGTDLRLFDIACRPPKQGRPSPETAFKPEELPVGSLSYAEFLSAIGHVFLRRNRGDFKWADGAEEPLAATEMAMPTGEDPDEPEDVSA